MDALGPLPALLPVRRTPSSDASPDERHPPGSMPEPPVRRHLPQQALLDALDARDTPPGRAPGPSAAPARPVDALPVPAAVLLQSRPDPALPTYGRPQRPGARAPGTPPEPRSGPGTGSGPRPDDPAPGEAPPSAPMPWSDPGEPTLRPAPRALLADRLARLIVQDAPARLPRRPEPAPPDTPPPIQLAPAAAALPLPAGLGRMLARLEHAFGHAHAALQQARQALVRDPQHREAAVELAGWLTEAGHPGEALALLDGTDPSPAPRAPRWHLARAAAWQRLQRPQEAAREASAALALAGADPSSRHEALHQLGQALARQGEHLEAAWCHRTRRDENPRDAGAALAAAASAAAEADWPALAQDQARLEQALAQPLPLQPDLRTLPDPALLAAFTDDPARLRQAAEQAVRARLGQHVERARARRRAARPAGARLRLGVLIGTPPEREAPPWPIVEMLLALDPARFELFAYVDRPDTGEAPLQRLRERAGRWHDCLEQDEQELALTIGADALDLLAVLDARADARRLPTLARHPAPLQIAWADGAGSTGAAFIDYLVGDPERTPLDRAADHVEAIAQMPRRHRPSAPPSPPPVPPDEPIVPPGRADCGLPERAMVYACFARPGAILPEQFAAWCRILADTDGAVLWLRGAAPAVRRRLQEAAASRGIDTRRLVFAPELDAARHAARLPLADLVLDTFPDSGERRCLEALQRGVPVLTRRGRSTGSRRAAALLQAVGLPELVCDGPERLHIEAVRLGRDAARRAALREQLHQRLQADPLHDPAGLARDFAALVRRMIDRLDAGLPPMPLAALPAP